MSRFTAKALIVAVALGATALTGEPASATPMAGAAAIEQAVPAAAGAEQVFFYRRGYYRRPFFRRRFYGPGYRRYGYGYRRGLPGRPIRRLLRSL